MKVVFRPRAEDDLNGLYDYISEQSGHPDVAFNYVLHLRTACQSLAEFSARGVPRDDIRKGLRLLIVERRSVVAYHVTDVVEILAIFHGGQDWQSVLLEMDT